MDFQTGIRLPQRRVPNRQSPRSGAAPTPHSNPPRMTPPPASKVPRTTRNYSKLRVFIRFSFQNRVPGHPESCPVRAFRLLPKRPTLCNPASAIAFDCTVLHLASCPPPFRIPVPAPLFTYSPLLVVSACLCAFLPFLFPVPNYGHSISTKIEAFCGPDQAASPTPPLGPKPHSRPPGFGFRLFGVSAYAWASKMSRVHCSTPSPKPSIP